MHIIHLDSEPRLQYLRLHTRLLIDNRRVQVALLHLPNEIKLILQFIMQLDGHLLGQKGSIYYLYPLPSRSLINVRAQRIRLLPKAIY